MTRALARSLALCLALAALFTVAPAHAVEVVIHRGANEYAPENTFAAAELAIEWGVDYVEIDVRTSQDGVMYILHDFSVDRTTDGKGFIHTLTSEEIDRLDAGSWFDEKFAGQRVPRLDEYLRWIKGRAKVYFDVKAADLEQLIALVYEVGLEDDCFFWFGAEKQAQRFRELDQRLPLKVNASDPAGVAKAHDDLAADIIEVGLGNLSDDFIDACRQRDLKIMVYHPRKDEEAFRQTILRGADMINLNHADVFLRVQRELAEPTTAN